MEFTKEEEDNIEDMLYMIRRYGENFEDGMINPAEAKIK